MNALEKHPMVPELSQEHDELVARLLELQNHAGDPHIKEKLQQAAAGDETKEAALTLLERAKRTEIGKIIVFTVMAHGDEADYSPDTPPRQLEDEEITTLINQTASLIGSLEQGPSPGYSDPQL